MVEEIAEIVSRVRERLERLWAGQAGVPVGAQMHDHAAHLAGVQKLEFYTNPRIFVDTMLWAADYYELDVPSCLGDVYNIEAEALGQKMVYRQHCMPEIDYTDPLIKEPKDLAQLKPPDPYRSGRLPMVLEVNRYFQEITGLCPTLTFCAPFSLAVGVRGYMNLVRDMRKDPPFAHALLEFLTMEVLVTWIQALARQNPGGASSFSLEAYAPVDSERANRNTISAFGADAWASMPVVDLGMLRDFVLPYVVKLQETLGDIAVGGWWGESHLKGSGPEEMMEMKVRCLGGKSLLVMDPDGYNLGPERIARFAVSQGVLLILGIDAVLLRDGPLQAIMDRVREYVRAGSSTVGLILFLNNLPADTPPDHVKAVLAAAKGLDPDLTSGGDQ